MNATISRIWSKRSVRRFRSNPVAIASISFLAALVVIAVLANVLAPKDPNLQDLMTINSGPSGAHWLGTDLYGRDILSRLIVSTRVSLQASAQAVSIGVLLGMPLGLIAGYRGGFLDTAMSRFADALLSIPGLLLAFAIVGSLGPGLTNAMLAVGIIMSPGFFRVARSASADVRSELYIEASRAAGCTRRRIIARHVLPNAAAPLLVQISIAAGVAIVAEASLSFLGLGVKTPQASWGSMINETFRDPARNSYPILPPALMIGLTVLAVSMLGDAIRDSIGRETRGGK